MWAFPDAWTLTVDADEFLVLPPGFDDLPRLVAKLDRRGHPCLTAPMVDFYGDTLNHRRHARHRSPFEGSPYFDAGPYYDWVGFPAPVPIPAGVHYRLQKMLALRHREDFSAVYGGKVEIPMSWKAPLIRNGRGVVRCGDHQLNVAPQTETTAALVHFKFYPGLDAKIDLALREGQYTVASKHYRFLDLAVRRLGDEPLASDATRLFKGPESLVAAGLIHAA
jgi:hypothetical protein